MPTPPDPTFLPDTPPFLAERDKLDPALRTEFDRLVEAYRFHAFQYYERPFVSYRILAALVRDGWRLSAESRDPSTENRSQ